MSNSPLATYTKLSPHCRKRTGKIDRITIHHAAGVGTAESIGANFQGSRAASANYGIGNDGRVGLYVPEEKRAFTSSSTVNDNRAVTIEVSNSATPKNGHPEWPVSEAAYRALIALCADICRRNGIRRLNYTGDATGNLTRHNMFAATACPGAYLQARFPAIAEEVNNILEEDEMTGQDIIDRLSDAEAYALLEKAQRHAATLPAPAWAQGGTTEAEQFRAAKEDAELTDGTRPMGLVTRLESALMAYRAALAAVASIIERYDAASPAGGGAGNDREEDDGK